MDVKIARSPLQHRLPGLRRGARGATLVEALVAIVLLGVALLGMAMLQAQSFKFSTGSYARTQANMLAYEIMDRMRVTALDGSATMSDYTGGDPGGSCDYDAVATNLVITNDLDCWYSKLGDILPGATGTITQAGALFTVTLTWTDMSIRLDSGNQKQTSFTFQPTSVGTAS